MVNKTIQVLDRGYVRLRNLAGPIRRADQEFDASDTDPANSARMSFNNFKDGSSPETLKRDLQLADYLMRNKHTTPFEMIVCWIEMKIPIFVARQFVRHRTVSINEISARYVTLSDEWYIPEIVGSKPENKKQGREENLSNGVQEAFKKELDKKCRDSYNVYLNFIEQGVAPEQARIFLHLNHYTKWLWKQDLHNMLHFLSLRDHSHAQYEAQCYAQAITKLLEAHLPETMNLYRKYRN